MGNNVSLESNRRGYSSFMGLGAGQSMDAHTGVGHGNNDIRKRQVFIDVIEKSWQEKIVL